MIVVGATWTIMYNADVLLGAGRVVVRPDSRARADSADVHRLPAAEPLPDRRDPRDVHTRGLHPRGRRDDERGVHARLQRRWSLRWRVRRRAHLPRRPARSETYALRSPERPGCAPGDFRVIGEPVDPAREGTTARDAAQVEVSYVVNGVDDTFLHHTTYGFAAAPAATARRRRFGVRSGSTGTSPSSTRSWFCGKANWGIAAGRPSSSPASTSKTRPSTRSR